MSVQHRGEFQKKYFFFNPETLYYWVCDMTLIFTKENTPGINKRFTFEIGFWEKQKEYQQLNSLRFATGINKTRIFF